MDPIPHNFYYDPMRQGDGRGVWNWYSGDPFQQGGYLVLLNGSGIMYYDCGKGNLSMTLNIPTAATTMDRQWGFKAGDDYVLFDVSGGTFQAKTASTRSQSTGSSTIAWDSAWTSTDTTFMVRWEAGIATFYINGIKRAQIADESIPYGPLSPFVFSDGSDLFRIKSVVGQGLQTLVLNPVETSADGGQPMGNANDAVSITESITSTTSTAGPSLNEALTLSESVTTSGPTGVATSVVDSLTITETTTGSVQMDFPTSVSDALTVSESVTVVN